jgi:hypothetical protein
VGCQTAAPEATIQPVPTAADLSAPERSTPAEETTVVTAEPVATPTIISEPAVEPTTTEPLPTVAQSPTPEIELVAGQWSDLVFHEGLQQVVLVNGGPEQGKSPDDPVELWGWDGANWSLLSADSNGPKWRNFGGVTYDTERDVLVLTGGLQGRARRMDDTWEWDGRQWTLRSEEGPVGREGAGIAYDSARGRVVLFGGSDGSTIFQDTWEWDGQTWEQVSHEGPSPRFPAEMVYDEAQQRVILYGGHAPTDEDFATNVGDIWVWDGNVWQELPAAEPYPGIRAGTALVYEHSEQHWLLFGGANDDFFNDTWAWDGQQWVELGVTGPQARSGHDMVYDSARQRVVLFGGVDRPGGGPITDTWEWDGQGWTCLAGCS